MQKSILLVGKYSIVEPLGLMLLSASLLKAGHEVGIYLMDDGSGRQLTSAAFSRDYDFVGFSVYTGFHKQMFQKANILKDDFEVIIGGPHATFFSEDCKFHAQYVVVGEGLKSVLSVVEQKAIPGIVFLSSLVPEDRLPDPDRMTLYSAYPQYRANRIKNVITSFGCPYRCHYCFNDSYRKLYPQTFTVRQKPVQQIVDECARLKEFDTELIFFQDDCFGFKMPWLEEFAFLYRKQVNIPFHCQVRPESVTSDRIRLFKEAGCHGVTMAIETFKEDIRSRLLNRKMTNTDIFWACEQIKKAGLRLRTEQMLGVPDSTFDDELELLKMNIQIGPDIAWTSIFVPYLGTTLGDYCKECGLYDGNNDDLQETFFSDSRLKFDKERLQKTNVLQKLFATFAKIPDGNILAKRFLENKELTFSTLFQEVKTHLFDHCLYKTGD